MWEGGVRACVGQMIARLEFDSVLKAMATHCAALELDGTPVHRSNNALRTLNTLPLRATPA